ncbi:hypothetical protein Tco_1012331, partial [Tanacetum coccineum]
MLGGLPDMIQESVMASKPKTMQEAIAIANDLMYQKIRTFAERQAKNKRKLDNNSSDNNTQQPPFKRNQGHYRSDCPQLKNRNHGNQDGGTEAHRMVYALGGGEADQDLD